MILVLFHHKLIPYIAGFSGIFLIGRASFMEWNELLTNSHVKAGNEWGSGLCHEWRPAYYWQLAKPIYSCCRIRDAP